MIKKFNLFINESKIIDGILDKINLHGVESLNKKEKELLDRYSSGEEIEDVEKEIVDKHQKVKGYFDYDPREDEFFDEVGFDFSKWTDKDIEMGRLNIIWNDLTHDDIAEFFEHYNLDISEYLDKDGDLPGDIPEDLVDKFNTYIKKIF